MAKARPKRTGLGKKLALSFFTALLLLGLLEGGSRLLGDFTPEPPQPLITKEHPPWMTRHAFDPYLFWRFLPSKNEGRKRKKINTLGLRGPEVPPKEDREFRILSLGESTTFAGRLRYEECYSARLEALLGTLEGKRVRVINAGIPGHTLAQGYAYLKYYGLDLEPDGVIIYFGQNDFLPVTYLSERLEESPGDGVEGMTDRELLDLRTRFRSRINRFFEEHSHFYRCVRYLLSGKEEREFLQADEKEKESYVKVSEKRVRVPEEDRTYFLNLIRDLCASEDIRFVIVVPWYLAFKKHEKLLRTYAEENGVPIVDLPALLKNLPQEKSEYFLDTVHPNAEGHQIIAEKIAEKILEL